jgi:septum formation protein
MLADLSGTTHAVLTGVAVVRSSGGHSSSRLVSSDVQMRRLSPAEIAAYVAGGQWQGKAGGYGIQDQDPFVTRITGSLSNIVGLPMEAAVEMLREAGVEPGPPQ